MTTTITKKCSFDYKQKMCLINVGYSNESQRFWVVSLKGRYTNVRNRKLEISTAPTKVKWREPAYLQALIQNKIDRQ